MSIRGSLAVAGFAATIMVACMLNLVFWFVSCHALVYVHAVEHCFALHDSECILRVAPGLVTVSPTSSAIPKVGRRL